jgi:cysteinyl-tRNA synthetase
VYGQRFKAAMDDDLNTPEAVAVLFDLANEVNRNQSVEAAAQLKTLAGVLGLLQREPQAFLQGDGLRFFLNMQEEEDDEAAEEEGQQEQQEQLGVINHLIEARITAKKSKNFAEADRIRKELLEVGIVLEDTPQGTTWRRA